MVVAPNQAGLENNEITQQGDILFVKLAGKQHSALAQATLARFKEAIADQRGKGKRVFVLVDVRELQIAGVPTDARLAIKEAFGQPFEALAAIGNSHLIEVSMYLMNAGGAKDRARYFTSERKARRWLRAFRVPKSKKSSGNMLLITSLLTGAIGVLGLAGWAADNRLLMGVLSDTRPINPLGAVGLIILAIGLFGIWHKRLRILGASSAALLILLGVLALPPIDIDHILFAEKVRAAGTHVQLADSAAICFITTALSMAAAGINTKLARALLWIMAGVTVGLAAFNLFGLLYAREFMYGISPSFVMAFNLALGFAICGVGYIAILSSKHATNMLSNMGRVGWFIMAAVVSVQIVTYTAWHQSIDRNETEAKRAFDLRTEELTRDVQQRVRAYLDALSGFRALYAASNGVNESEFGTYYRSLDLAKNYPGFRAISFISRVGDEEIGAFVNERRRDTSIHPNGQPDFAIQEKSVRPIHYILTYVADNPDSTFKGQDFADVTERRITYERALAAGVPSASQTVDFVGTANQTTKGFFITIPVDHASLELGDKPNNLRYTGFVNAVFYYDDFFKSALGTSSLLAGLDVNIVDTSSGGVLFKSSRSPGDDGLQRTNNITVADKTWTIAAAADRAFGTAGIRALSQAILVGGQAVALLLIVVFWLQNRARQRALNLADAITADLQYERNHALSLQQKDDAILSSIGDAVFAVDTKGHITLFNPAAEHISGFSADEAIGKHYSQILHFEVQGTGKRNDAFIKKALAGSLASMEGHTQIIRKDGSRLFVADSAAPIHDLTGKLVGAIVIFRDVSKEYELDRAKTEFVSLASHQLRTPLSAINWYAEMLLNGDAGKITTDQRSYLQEIYEGNQRMIELVNSLLDVSRLEVGKLISDPAVNHPEEVIESLVKELATSITGKQLAFTSHIEPKLPDIIADPKLLRMIFQNLMSNAVKYTPAKGSVTVTARIAKEADLKEAALKSAEPHLYFSVKDTGYGIPKEQQAKIFSKLFRADNARSLDVEGTGLGLYIVKEVVEKLGGRVWFTSVESAGSTFTIVIPCTTKKFSK